MRFSSAIFGSALVASVAAAPNDLFKRATCNRDNCLRAVIASNTNPGFAQAGADCASFLGSGGAVVTPSAVTTTASATVTTTKTITGSTTTVTTSPVTTFVSTATAFAVVTVTDTTVTDSTTTTTTSLSVSTVIITSTITSGSVGVANRKRQANTLSSSSSTSTATGAIPAYASLCSDAARYSSACSCRTSLYSESVSVRTLSTPTSTVTATVTSTVISSASGALTTLALTQTSSSTTTSTVTSTSHTTVRTTRGAVLTVTSSSTTTTTTTTVQPSCTSFVLRVASGTYAGGYLVDAGSTRVDGALNEATTFTLQNGLIYYPDPQCRFASPFGTANFVNKGCTNNPSDTQTYQYQPLVCSATSGTGAITCSAADGSSGFSTCAYDNPTKNRLLIGQKPLGNSQVTCTPLTLVAVARCPTTAVA